MFLLSIFDGQKRLGETELTVEPVTIGRDPENTIVIADGSVSRQHARLEPQGNFLLLRDQGSSNGTFLNGRPVEAAFLEDGDSIRIGRYLLRVAAVDAAAPEKGGGRSGQPVESGREPATEAIDEAAALCDPESRTEGPLERLCARTRELGALDRPEVFLERILEIILIELDANRASIFLGGLEGCAGTKGAGGLVLAAARSRVLPKEAASTSRRVLSALEVPEEVVASVLRDRSPVFWPPARAPGAAKGPPSAGSALCVPLPKGNQLQGVLYIERAWGRPPFGIDESRVASAIAALSSNSIAHASLLAGILRGKAASGVSPAVREEPGRPPAPSSAVQPPAAQQHSGQAGPSSLVEKVRVEELRRSITGNFARKLRSLLTVLEGNLPLIHPAVPEEAFEADVLRDIERTSQELCEFADQFLEFAEMEIRAVRGPASRVPAPLCPLVRRAIVQAAEAARPRRILISDRLPKELPPVTADVDRLQRALGHILTNLVKLCGDGTILAIEGGSERDVLRIDFSCDEGPQAPAAAPPEGLAGVDPIGRFTAGKVPGASLGLAIARQIILEHGGDLIILNPPRGGSRGACLSIRLPLAAAEKARATCGAGASS